MAIYKNYKLKNSILHENEIQGILKSKEYSVNLFTKVLSLTIIYKVQLVKACAI